MDLTGDSAYRHTYDMYPGPVPAVAEVGTSYSAVAEVVGTPTAAAAVEVGKDSGTYSVLDIPVVVGTGWSGME